MADEQLIVSGLPELRRALKQLEPDLLPILRGRLKAAGELVAADARSRVPVRSGAARDSVRATAGGNTVYIVGGKSKVPYYGWLDFGGRLGPTGSRRNTQVRPALQKGRYIYPAIAHKMPAFKAAVESAVDEATLKVGLR